MKSQNGKTFLATAFAAMLAATAGAEQPAYVNGARVEGAEPGEWTHDWDAATAAAKKDGKPVFVNFTGSDWCGWCKLLKRQVFTQPEWGAWASNHVYLVHLDFPNDKALVPEKYRERNRELSRRYKVGGYPTCYLLDPATLEPIGRFGASRDASAADFVEKVSAAMPGAKKAVEPADTAPAAPRRPDGPGPARPSAGEPVFQIENGVLRDVRLRPNGAEEIIVPAEAKIVYIDRIWRVRRIVFSEGVEEIRRGDWGYTPGDPLESVSIPKSVRKIQPGAFYGYYRKLQSIDIAEGAPYSLRGDCLVDTRDATMLYALPGRERIDVPVGVKSIADHAFSGNGDIREAVLPDGVEKIGSSAFSGCRSLESVTIPATVSEIGDYAFSNCRHLSTIDVVAGNPRYSVSNGLLVDRNTKTIVRGIGGLRRVNVPVGTEAIATGAFSGMESLVSATVPDSVKSIGNYAFAYCPELVELRLPKRVAACGGGIVRGCARLKSIEFPVGTKRFGGQDLNGCDSLCELDVPEGVVSLDGWRTISCRELARLSLPASLRTTSGSTFGSIPQLDSIDVHPDNPSFRSEDGVLFSKDMTRLVRCPETKKGVYAVPGTVKRIDGYAFANCRALTEIRIPEGATSIGRDSFENCPAKTNRVAAAESVNRPVQGPTATTNDFKAVLTGIAVVDDKRRHNPDEATFVPPETKVVVPYGKTALFRVEFDFPKGYQARVWTLDGMCDDGKNHSWYFGSNPSGMFEGKGTAYGFLSLLERGKSCRVRELLLKTSSAPALDNSPKEWTMAMVPIDVEFLEMRRAADTAAESKRPDHPVATVAAGGAFTGTPGKIPLDKLPAADRIAWFDFSEGKADKVRPDRSFDCRNVAFEDGAMRFNGVYVNSIEGRTNGCNAELRVPELDCDGFTVCLSFRPERNGRSYLPLLNFGHARRWFSANLGRNGRVWFGLNCYDVQIETEGRAVDGDWNWLVCSVDAVGKTVRAALNGVRLDDAHLPSDFFYKLLPTQLESLKTVDTTFWNGGDAFKGEIAHFVLIGRPLSDGEFKAFSAASAPAGWTAKTGTSKSMYWNSMLSDGKRDIPARVDGSRVFLHPGLQGASGAVDLRGPVADDTGKTIRIVGIGQEPSIQKDLFVGGGCAASSVLLPDSLEWIGRAGFKGCRNLRELKIPASVKSIGADAFADCPALERIEFEDRTFKLNDNVFGTPVRGEKVRRPATNLEGE